MPRPRFGLLFLLLATLPMAACYDRTEKFVLNPDGSGKVLVETDVVVPLPADAGKEATLDAGRKFAANLINGTRGVDAWASVEVVQLAPGKVHVTGVAYFADIHKLRFDVPLVFGWEKQADGSVLFSITREHNPQNQPPNMTDAEIAEQVKQAQTRYKEQQGDLTKALTAFRLQMAFALPGEAAAFHQFTRADNTLSLTIDGNKVMPAIDKFMADDKAIASAIKSGDALLSNDDLLLESMYGHGGRAQATLKIPADAAAAFNYRLESRTAQLAQADMLEAQKIELIPKFIVTPPAPPQK